MRKVLAVFAATMGEKKEAFMNDILNQAVDILVGEGLGMRTVYQIYFFLVMSECRFFLDNIRKTKLRIYFEAKLSKILKTK